jgi:hypothetical protein
MSDDFITLSCPSCGAKLDITPDIDRFACLHCGREHIVKRSGGIVALSPVIDAIKRVGVGIDKVAGELALVRLSKEIADLQTAKDKSIDSYQEPSLGFWPRLFLILGGIIVLVGFGILINDHTVNSYSCLISGFLILILGLILTFSFFPYKEKAKQEFMAKVKYWDDQIDVRQTQIKQINELLAK